MILQLLLTNKQDRNSCSFEKNVFFKITEPIIKTTNVGLTIKTIFDIVSNF